MCQHELGPWAAPGVSVTLRTKCAHVGVPWEVRLYSRPGRCAQDLQPCTDHPAEARGRHELTADSRGVTRCIIQKQSWSNAEGKGTETAYQIVEEAEPLNISPQPGVLNRLAESVLENWHEGLPRDHGVSV